MPWWSKDFLNIVFFTQTYKVFENFSSNSCNCLSMFGTNPVMVGFGHLNGYMVIFWFSNFVQELRLLKEWFANSFPVMLLRLILKFTIIYSVQYLQMWLQVFGRLPKYLAGITVPVGVISFKALALMIFLQLLGILNLKWILWKHIKLTDIVFPDPVCAIPTRSLPLSATGQP